MSLRPVARSISPKCGITAYKTVRYRRHRKFTAAEMSYDPSTVHPGAPLGASASFSSLPTSDIPAMGLGTFQAGPEGMMTLEAAVLGALDTGYRHIDTAWAYGDGDVERKVGEGLAKWMSKGGRREEIFVVTKLYVQNRWIKG